MSCSRPVRFCLALQTLTFDQSFATVRFFNHSLTLVSFALKSSSQMYMCTSNANQGMAI